jgi:hypothetical protein
MSNNRMTFAMRIAVLACLSSTLGLAESWSGTLVDSRCWDSEENNTRATSIYVDRDSNLGVRLCSPKAKTKSFAVVLPDGLNLKLDAAGNQRAAERLQKSDKKNAVTVIIIGEANGNTIAVASISMAR